MMMTLLQRMVGLPPVPQQPHAPSTSRYLPVPSYSFTPGQDFQHLSPSPFTTDHPFTNPNPPVSPPYYDDDCSYQSSVGYCDSQLS